MINHPTSQPLKCNNFHLRAALLHWVGPSLSALIKPSYAPPTPPSDSAVTVAIILVVSVSGSNQLYGACLESYCSITRVSVSWMDVFIHGVQMWEPGVWSVCLLICWLVHFTYLTLSHALKQVLLSTAALVNIQIGMLLRRWQTKMTPLKISLLVYAYS